MTFINLLSLVPQALADNIIGKIEVPTGVPSDTKFTTPFISAVIRFMMVLGGLFSLWNFLSGGFQMITSNGEKGKLAEAQQKIQMSILGLVVMTASFIIIAIISKILFGSYTFILNPQLQSVQ